MNRIGRTDGGVIVEVGLLEAAEINGILSDLRALVGRLEAALTFEGIPEATVVRGFSGPDGKAEGEHQGPEGREKGKRERISRRGAEGKKGADGKRGKAAEKCAVCGEKITDTRGGPQTCKKEACRKEYRRRQWCARHGKPAAPPAADAAKGTPTPGEAMSKADRLELIRKADKRVREGLSTA